MSRCQETVLGASILLRVQKKSMNEQVESHDRDVISGDGGDNCYRGHFALTTCQAQPRVFHVYEFILLHNYPMRYPHFTKKKMGTRVTGWQGLDRQALIARCCDTGCWRPVCSSEGRAAELKSKGCEGGNWLAEARGEGAGIRTHVALWTMKREPVQDFSWGVPCPDCPGKDLSVETTQVSIFG